MRETRGALGRLATKSLNFFIKEGTKVLAVCVAEKDECLILHTSERLSDRERQTAGRMNDIRGLALEQKTLLLAPKAGAKCVSVCVCLSV